MAGQGRPVAVAGNPAAGLLVLLVMLYLLLAYFAGRLEWLFSLGQAVGAARASSSTATNPPPGSASDGSYPRPPTSGSGGTMRPI